MIYVCEVDVFVSHSTTSLNITVILVDLFHSGRLPLKRIHNSRGLSVKMIKYNANYDKKTKYYFMSFGIQRLFFSISIIVS